MAPTVRPITRLAQPGQPFIKERATMVEVFAYIRCGDILSMRGPSKRRVKRVLGQLIRRHYGKRDGHIWRWEARPLAEEGQAG